MFTRARLCPLIVVLCVSLATTSLAAESKNPLRRLFSFPFGKKAAKSSQPSAVQPASGINLLPGAAEQKRKQKRSIPQKINDGTRALLTKTKDVLTPGKKTPRSSELSPPFGLTKPRDKGKKKSVFSSFFAPEQPEEQPKTLLEWLALPKPDF